MDNLNIEEKKEPAIENNPDELGPIMGFFAVEPIKECPHCVPGVNITPVEEFKDISINTPCYNCGHTKENWVCLKTKVVGCSRYVNSCMVKYNEKEKNPIALSFADFSYWCYECDSYVISKYLNHVQKHFYAQKFGADKGVSHLTEYALINNSKATMKDRAVAEQNDNSNEVNKPTAKCVFVYGSLRPDDDSGMPWTK